MNSNIEHDFPDAIQRTLSRASSDNNIISFPGNIEAEHQTYQQASDKIKTSIINTMQAKQVEVGLQEKYMHEFGEDSPDAQARLQQIRANAQSIHNSQEIRAVSDVDVPKKPNLELKDSLADVKSRNAFDDVEQLRRPAGAAKLGGQVLRIIEY